MTKVERFRQGLKKLRADGKMLVFVGAVSEDSPAGYVINIDLFVHLDWMPKNMTADLVLDKEMCQRAVDGDVSVRHYIESEARRSITRSLLADLKRVLPEGAVVTIAAKEAIDDQGRRTC